MMQIDSAILATDKVICKNISRFDDSERGLLSQNILSQLRNFVEYIADCTELITSIASYRTVIRVQQFNGVLDCIKLAILYCLMNQTASLL